MISKYSQKMHKPLISIIIVSYNVKKTLVECIESIIKFTKSNFDYEIIIIDNSSTDGTSNNLFLKHKNVRYIQNTSNIGFTKALNQGINIANGDFLFQLNPDTLLFEEVLEKIYASLIQNEGDILGPQILDSKGNVTTSHWKKPGLLSTVLNISNLQSLINKFRWKKISSNPIFVDSISGAAMFYKKTILDEIGNFNEDLFWDEDIDFCLRAKKFGKKITFMPNIRLIHFGGESSNKKQKLAITNQILSKIKFFKIHNSKIEYRMIVLICLLIIPIKIFFMIILSPFKPRLLFKIYPYFVTFKLIVNKDFSVQLN